MPHQFRSGGGGVVESSSHKWRRKILRLTREDYDFEQGILTPHKPERSDYAIDNSVFNSRFHGNRKAEKLGRQVKDNYHEIDMCRPIQTISRSSDGRFILGDQEVKEDRTDYMTLDSSVYPTTHARASHIQGSQGKGQVQDGRRQCHMQSSRDYVQLYHPQYYLMQDKDKELGLPPQRMRYPDVHQAALEAPSYDHTVPTNDENGFYPVADRAPRSAGPQYGRRRYRRRELQPSGGNYSHIQRPPSGRTLSYNQPPSGHTDNYTMYPPHDHGIYSQIQEQGSNGQYKTHQRRSRSADSYYGNYANYPTPHNEYSSRSRPIRREDDYVRISSRSAPATPGYRSRPRDYSRDRRSGTTTLQDHNYDQIPYYHPSPRTRHYHSQRRSATPHSSSSTPYSSRSKGLTTPHCRGTSGTPYSRGRTETPGADYKSYLTSSPDIADGSGEPFIISDISSVQPGSSLMTSSNQMPSSLVTSPSLQMTSSYSGRDGGGGTLSNQYQHPSPFPDAPKDAQSNPDGLTPEVRNHSLLHQRSLSDGDGIHWRNPQQYLYSGTAPLADERVDEGVYSPRTVEFMDRYIADVDNKARRKKHGDKTLFHPLQTHLAPDPPVSNGNSPEELAYTRDKLDKAIKHVRKGRLQPSYGYSAPELDNMHHGSSQEQTTPRPDINRHHHHQSSEQLNGSRHERPDSSFAQSVAPYKEYSGSKPTSVASSSGRGSGSHITGRGTRYSSQGALQTSVDQPDHGHGHSSSGTTSKDSTHSTSGLGSKDTFRSVSSQGGPPGTGSQDHMITPPHDSRSSHSPTTYLTPHPSEPPSHSNLATQETSGDENYEFDSALEAELMANLQKSGRVSNGVGIDVDTLKAHSPSPEVIDPNESVDEKFERLRREYKEFQSSSQENLDYDVPPQYSQNVASGSSWNEFESEML